MPFTELVSQLGSVSKWLFKSQYYKSMQDTHSVEELLLSGMKSHDGNCTPVLLSRELDVSTARDEFAISASTGQ